MFQHARPVIVHPLRQEWVGVRCEIEALLSGKIKPGLRRERPGIKPQRMSARQAAEERRAQFSERLRTLSILDPACGSGNFLYLALQSVKDLELQVNVECEALGMPRHGLQVGPEILKGIEVN